MTLLTVGVAVLCWLSFNLSATRIYQVDECINVLCARNIAVGHSEPGMELFQLILSRFMSAGLHATDLFANARLFAFVVFWLNLILLALATGERILSRRWLVALAFAATLAPLWDYGFEVRHDNVLLTGILLIWGIIRFQPPKLGPFFFIGACFVTLEFISIKAIVYTVPISLGIFLFPPPGQRRPRWQLFAAWCLGAIVSFFVLRLLYRAAGMGQDYLATVQGVASVPSTNSRFWPIPYTLPRLLTQTPLLVAVAISALVACVGTIVRQRRAALNWDGILPESLLLCAVMAALFVNPNPYPYNLLHVVPYAFLLAFRYGSRLGKQLAERSTTLAPVAIGIIVFTHVVPFAMTTRRHWMMQDFRQEQLMDLTEELTDPDKDFIFDGIGMVPTRKVCDRRAFIHGQSLKSLVDGSMPHIRDMLAANPPSVVILSYRTDWLPPEDQDFINRRYVRMADDFMVLGSVLPVSGGTFEIYHAGRYRITSAEGSNIIGTYPEPKNILEAAAPPKEEPPLNGVIDGTPLNGKPIELSAGTHRLECPQGQRPAVVWVGPHADEILRMPGNDHRNLFINWY